MKLFLLAAGSLSTGGVETAFEINAVKELENSLLPGIITGSNSHNSMDGMPKLSVVTKRRRPAALQIPALTQDESVAKFIHLADTNPTWAVTKYQQDVFGEHRLNGLDVTSEQAIKTIKQEALMREMTAIKQAGMRKEILRADFAKAVEIHDLARKKRILIQNQIESPGFKGGEDPSILHSYISALRKEYEAFADLDMQRLISYPKTGFNTLDISDIS